MHRGHHLALGIKRKFMNTRILLHFLIDMKQRFPICAQRNLCRLSLHGSIRMHLRIIAQAHCQCKQTLIITEMLHHLHTVLCQGTGFIRTDYLCTAQCFHSGQLSYDCIALCHARHTDCKLHRYYRRKALRNSRNSKGNSQHEGIQ